ncbi:peptidoglycan-binding protein, partial [Streptomyces sp. NPDC002133]|uniref:peptidoglycan-binding protein n=1 Tax=Streptomyces sp. NPDC002133 TaxID=3154409 RepID=UPI0033314DAF
EQPQVEAQPRPQVAAQSRSQTEEQPQVAAQSQPQTEEQPQVEAQPRPQVAAQSRSQTEEQPQVAAQSRPRPQAQAQVPVPASVYPGRAHFRPGQSNAHVEELGRQLVERGFGKHYLTAPGRQWTEADRRNVEAFQRAQGWRGGAADGYPGPETWRRLFS